MVILKVYNISRATLVNCFAHASFSSPHASSKCNPQGPAEVDEFIYSFSSQKILNTSCLLEKFLNIGNDVVCETLADGDILDNVPVNNEYDGNEQEESNSGEPPSTDEVYAACQILHEYNLTNGKPSHGNFDKMCGH